MEKLRPLNPSRHEYLKLISCGRRGDSSAGFSSGSANGGDYVRDSFKNIFLIIFY